MPGRSALTIEQVLPLLRETPSRIAALAVDLTPDQLRTAPAPGEWSANDVLAHLRACADMWGGSITRIVAEDRPTFAAVNPQAWIKQTDYPTLAFEPSFRAYAAQRAELLALLESLPRESWERTATVKVWGATLERTVFFYAQWLARHERSHVKPFATIVNTVR